MPSLLPDLIPARILNEYVYCPRLAYLEWVDQHLADNADATEGSSFTGWLARSPQRHLSRTLLPWKLSEESAQ
jgi:hypothetical protein